MSQRKLTTSDAIVKALQKHKGSVRASANSLGISYRTLYRRIKENEDLELAWENIKTGKRVHRAAKYKTAKQLQTAIDDYFKNGVQERTIIIKGKQIKMAFPTITGLTYYLGFASRASFYDLEKLEHLTYTIKRARLFIEKEYEEQLIVGNSTGAIFALKNMGWADKFEHHVTPEQITGIQIIVDNT